MKNKLTLPNAHCNQCHKCVTPCPDSTPGINPLSTTKTIYHRLTGLLTVGAFPGFVWGWFQVKDYTGTTSITEIITIYKLPTLAALTTCALYLLLRQFFKKKVLTDIFAATAISCYYWFRIPSLFGFGIFPDDGMLIDLSATIPEWFIQVIVYALTLFFFGWIVLSKNKNSWTIRPNYAKVK